MPERDKVIKELESLRDICSAKSNMAIGNGKIAWAGYANTADDALALLKEQEAKTGKWIEKEDYNLETYYDCSVCGESWTTIEGNPWWNGMNYCPNCGAKMEKT